MDVAQRSFPRLRTFGLPLLLLSVLLLSAARSGAQADPPPSGGGTGPVRVDDTVFVAGGAAAPEGAVVDSQAPEIRWQVTGPEVFEDRGEPRERSRKNPRAVPRREGKGPALAWSADGRKWLPLKWGEGETGEDGAWAADHVPSEHPQVFFAAPGTRLSAGGEELQIGNGQVLWVTAEDAGAGVARLNFRTRPASPPTGVNPQAGGVPPAGSVLEVEAVDLVGNSSRFEWALSPRR